MKAIFITVFVSILLFPVPSAEAENPSRAQEVPAAGITNTSALSAATEAAIDGRRKQVLDWSHLATLRADSKYGPYDILAATARDGCGPPERAQYMANLGQMGLDHRDFEMFALAPLVRYLYMYPQCLSAGQREYLRKGLSSGRRNVFAHGTMNHMVLQETSWYLLAQYFPDTTWTDESSALLTSAQVMAQIKNLLARRHWRSFQSGMSERLSPTYAFTNLYPVLNLVDFARDPEVAQQAADEASLEVLILKADSFHGVMMPPVTRHNVDQSNAPLQKDWRSFAPSPRKRSGTILESHR